MSVEVQGLTKQYGAQKAVNDISFSIKKGEIVGFLGPNGAGKSTTMKMLTCFLTPTAGTANICGKSIYDDAVEVRRNIGYLPEHNPLYLDMYVREYLEFSGKMQGMKTGLKRRIDNMIELTGLGLEQKKKLKQLSKGYRQRAGLAQALLHDPEVLILDEPTSGLDPKQIVEIRKVIKETGSEKTVILSTHIMQEVQVLCDRVLIINHGNIVANDSAQNLLHRFSGRETVVVQFKNNMNATRLEQIEGVLEVGREEESYTLVTSGNVDVREAVFGVAVEENNPILSMTKQAGNLENVFLELTKATA